MLMPEADDTLVVTTWIPLVDATEENGTIHLYPELHSGEIRRHVRCPYGWTIAPEVMPEGEPVIVPGEKRWGDFHPLPHPARFTSKSIGCGALELGSSLARCT